VSTADVALGVPVIYSALTDLWYGFGVALEPHNLLFCFIGVLIGNIVGVLPAWRSRHHLDPAAAHLRNEAGGRHPDAGRRLLRRPIWWRHLLDLAQSTVSSTACGDLPGRLSDDQAGARRRGLGITVFASFVGASWASWR